MQHFHCFFFLPVPFLEYSKNTTFAIEKKTKERKDDGISSQSDTDAGYQYF